ncbi:hypothetical protein ABKN59_008467 [Abortiporus biennis]
MEMDLSQHDLAYILYISGVQYNNRCHIKWFVNPNSETAMQKLYEAASRATGEDGVLEAALRQAWKSKDFSEIWNAVFLRNTPPLVPPSGDDIILREHKFCLLFLALTLTSSGSGKSRLVDELASLIFTIPINLRDPKESKWRTFPDPDLEVTDFLTVRGCEMTIRIRFQAFFGSLFEETYNWIKTHGDSQTSATLTMSGKSYMNDLPQRDAFYGGVIRKAEEKLRDSSDALRLAVEQREKPNSLKELCGLLPGKNEVKVVVYFDEAQEPRKVHTSGGTESNYKIMLLMLNRCVFQPLFVLFLSTSSSISPITPHPEQAKFAHMFSNFYLAPFTEMPFDCAPGFLVNYNKQLTLQEISKPTFLSKFGRPLYWAYLLGSEPENIDMVVKSLLNTLRRKLLDDTAGGFIQETDGALAVADVRLCLEYDPHAKAYGGKTSELVSSNMRTIYSVPPH